MLIIVGIALLISASVHAMDQEEYPDTILTLARSNKNYHKASSLNDMDIQLTQLDFSGQIEEASVYKNILELLVVDEETQTLQKSSILLDKYYVPFYEESPLVPVEDNAYKNISRPIHNLPGSFFRTITLSLRDNAEINHANKTVKILGANNQILQTFTKILSVFFDKESNILACATQEGKESSLFYILSNFTPTNNEFNMISMPVSVKIEHIALSPNKSVYALASNHEFIFIDKLVPISDNQWRVENRQISTIGYPVKSFAFQNQETLTIGTDNSLAYLNVPKLQQMLGLRVFDTNSSADDTKIMCKQVIPINKGKTVIGLYQLKDNNTAGSYIVFLTPLHPLYAQQLLKQFCDLIVKHKA